MFRQLGDFINRSYQEPKNHKPVTIPGEEGRQKLTILFDLDETLVHCDIKNVTKSFETRIRIQLTNQYGRKVLVVWV